MNPKELWTNARKVNFKKFLNSRSVLVIGCVALIGVAVLINALLPSEAATDETGKLLGNSVLVDQNVSDLSEDTNTVGSSDYFAVATLNRSKTRDEAMDILKTIAESEDALADAKEQALNDIVVMVEEMAKEANIEALIKAKGFDECVTIISGTTANVIVKSEGLLETEVAQILEIVYSETGITPASVKIIEKA